MGSIGFERLDTYGVRVTHARFPAAASIELHAHDRPTLGVVLEGGFDLVFNSGRHRRQFECVDGCVYGEPAGLQHADNIYQVGARVLTALVLSCYPSQQLKNITQTTMILMAGWDPHEVKDPGEEVTQTGCLIWVYPADNADDLETVIGSIDFVPPVAPR